MPIYEIRYYSGSGNWVIEGRGYWLTSIGEFSRFNEKREFTNLREKYNGTLLATLNEEEAAIFLELNYILSAVLMANATTKKD